MRITQGMLAANSLRHISQSYERLETYHNQLATGNKITRPSDDPVVAMKGMYYRTSSTEIEQHQRNISEVHLWMENSEAGLDQVNSLLQRMRELVVQAKNDTNNPENRQAIAKEIEQLKQDLVQTANTQVAGRYIFNGTEIDRAPVSYDEDGGTPDSLGMNTNEFRIEVSKGITMQANIDSSTVFSQDLFDTVSNLHEQLEDGESSEQLDGLLQELDDHLSNLSAERSELGARANRLELIESRLATQEVIAKRVLSDNEDADIERVITDLTTQESVHRAALSVGAKIIQPTLMDFLR